MRTIAAVLAAAAAFALTGCAMSPRPARTEVTPGEIEIRSEREERRPSESTLRIRASTPALPPAPAPQEPPVRIRIILPAPAPQEPEKDGAE